MRNKSFFFGWGGWGRGFLPDSVTDGFWIIIFAEYGIFGLGAFFGLAVLSGWRGVKSTRLLNTVHEQRLMIGHALMVFVILVDQIPNHSLHSWLWFFIGALLGRANHVFKEQKNENIEISD